MRYVIEANNLYKSYGAENVVKGLSFQVTQGECFGLLGPNGAGKTSTFKMMYGSARINSGELFILGLNAKQNTSIIKSMIGVVPQENGLDPDFSVLDNLLVYGRYFRLNRNQLQERANELLAKIQLEEYADRKIDELSGGMKRRLVLARALLCHPKIIFLDEPTTGLDPQARAWLWDELKEMKKNGTTLFLTTHYMEEAEYLCDRILIMNKGTAVAEGAPIQLIENYVGREVIEFEVSPREIEYYVSKIKNKFNYQVMRNSLKLFLSASQTHKEALDEISSPNITMRKASLNDVFLKISGSELDE